MFRFCAKALAVAGLMWPFGAWAQALPVTQCVSTAIAGGTGDAITVPKLPCDATSTLLVLTLTNTSSSTTPTIQQIGVSAPQIVLSQAGGPLVAGQLFAGTRVILTYNGTNWFVLNQLTANILSNVSVPTLAALQAALTASYPAGVWRSDYSTGLGAPPLWYVPETGTCAFNGRISDGGSCVNTTSGDGNSFYAVFPAQGADGRQWGMSTTSSNNATALTAACTYAILAGVPLNMPSGQFTFLSQVTCPFPNAAAAFKLIGAGKGETVFYWPNGAGGLVLLGNNVANEFHVRMITFSTGVANGGSGLTLNQTATIANPANVLNNDITDCIFKGSDWTYNIPSGTHYWTAGVKIISWSFVNWLRDDFSGAGSIASIGLQLTGTSSSIGVVYNVDNSNFIELVHGVEVDNHVQGVVIRGSQFDGDTTGVYTSNTQTDFDQLVVGPDNQFGFMGGNAIDIEGMHNGLSVQGNLIQCANTFACVYVNSLNTSSGAINISGNQFVAPAGNQGIGIQIHSNPALTSGLITGNSFAGLHGGQAVQFDSGATDWTLGADNIYVGVGIGGTGTLAITDNSTSTTFYPQTYVGGNSGGNVAPNTAVFGATGSFNSGTEFFAAQISSGYYKFAGSQMKCEVQNAPTGVQSDTFTLDINGVAPASGPVCTITGANLVATGTGSVVITPGQLWDIDYLTSTTAVATPFLWGGILQQMPVSQ